MPDKNQERENENCSGLRRINVLWSGIHLGICVLLLLSLISTVSALKRPEEYGLNQCELIAKDYQAEYYGDIIFIIPLKENGAYDIGVNNGHWINKAYSKEQGTYYIDYKNQLYFQSTDSIKAWYKFMTGKNSEVFNMNQGGAPFQIKYYY